MWLVVLAVGAASAGLDYGMDFLNSYRRTAPAEPNYNETFFPPLQNYQVNATPATETKYPWIGRVVHSKTQGHPYLCTAVCIEDEIFITAARCLHSLKVFYTSVLYQQWIFPVNAFVLPSNKSKQAFDDIGIMVVDTLNYNKTWVTVPILNTNRTDDNFNWFADLIPENNWDHVVVGYATTKDLINIYLAKMMQYNLKELNITVNINICPDIVIYNNLINGFHVPCFHSCSPQEFKNKDAKCSNYLGVLGSAVYNTKTNKLLGIATWGAGPSKYELPVGFSTPNSKSFFQDLTCARRIKQDNGPIDMEGHLQSLCEDIK